MAGLFKVAAEAEDDGGLLSDRIRNALTDEIASGALVAGSALEEQQLADRFGASRTPVREALRQLVVGGLVEVRGRRGLVVARMTPERIMDMFETSAEVEAMCVRLATYRMTPLERSDLIDAQRISRRAGAGCPFAAQRLPPHAIAAGRSHSQVSGRA